MADLGDARVRSAAFTFLDGEVRRTGSDVLPRELLGQGFVLDGHRVPILGPAGIFKPAVLAEMPLSITTVPVEEGEAPPYRDVIGHEGLLRYCYRGTDPSHNLGSPLSPGLPIPLGRRVRLVPAVPETEGSEGGCLDGGRVGCRRTAQRAWLFLGISA